MRRIPGMVLVIVLCSASAGLALDIHLHCDEHSHASSHDQCPTCFGLTVGFGTVVAERAELHFDNCAFPVCPIPIAALQPATWYRADNPRAPPSL